jgi:hypothetical protein
MEMRCKNVKLTKINQTRNISQGFNKRQKRAKLNEIKEKKQRERGRK